MSSSGQNSIDPKQVRSKIAIIGGSGLCSFPELKVISKVRPETKYGLPSDDILICEYKGKQVAFLPRHGSKHLIPPHKVPYKANLAALKEIGVEYVIGTCIVGSLRKEIAPGSLVVLDQFVNLTWGRDNSFEADGTFVHLPMGEPYCEKLRQLVKAVADHAEIEIIPQGTVAVIQGPRFSTIAESRWLSVNGWDVVNMTQYPECYFARELGMCYVAIAAVTDYDVGLKENLVMDPRNMDAVLEVFRSNIQKTKALVLALIEQESGNMDCKCASTVLKAYYEQ